jgi:hypothetical protein
MMQSHMLSGVLCAIGVLALAFARPAAFGPSIGPLPGIFYDRQPPPHVTAFVDVGDLSPSWRAETPLGRATVTKRRDEGAIVALSGDLAARMDTFDCTVRIRSPRGLPVLAEIKGIPVGNKYAVDVNGKPVAFAPDPIHAGWGRAWLPSGVCVALGGVS